MAMVGLIGLQDDTAVTPQYLPVALLLNHFLPALLPIILMANLGADRTSRFNAPYEIGTPF
jgi:hypothetical protein